jgi:hypothetical protein
LAIVSSSRVLLLACESHVGKMHDGRFVAYPFALSPFSTTSRDTNAEAFRRGDERGRVCCPSLPEELTQRDVDRVVQQPKRAMRRVLEKADLPRHFTMHSLRHSFCSLLVSSGVSPVYVQQQAGHADVGFTVRVYGSWFPATLTGR